MNSQHINNRPVSFREVLDRSLRFFFLEFVRVTIKNPQKAYFFYKTVRWQKRAARLRASWNEKDVNVPPIMIFSITNRCNLHCTGCYHQAISRPSNGEMNAEKLRSVFREATDMGISFCILAGGEPLLRQEILDITNDFPEIIFLVFTNGLLIDDNLISKLKKQNNFIPVISMEGYEEGTDNRRGKGVYSELINIIEKIKARNIFWCVSLTVTRLNFESVTDSHFIRTLFNLGCKLFFFLEYTPIKEDTNDWILTNKQRADLLFIRNSLRQKFKALFITVPGDENEIGGCMSAGKGFIHINAEGDVEPCPFAPYSDTNLMRTSLKDALQSEFLMKLRQNLNHLTETEGGCALWIKRDWVRSVLQGKTLIKK
jgi:MoaA/NifB/PqqE/SkfB family radical SAM enzyme